MFRKFHKYEKLYNEFINSGFDNNDITFLFIYKQVKYHFDRITKEPKIIEKACRAVYDYYTSKVQADITEVAGKLAILYGFGEITFCEEEVEIFKLLDNRWDD